MSRVVALMDDLFFQMKVAETAKHLGVELRVATTGEALLSLLEPRPGLVIVDLNSRNRTCRSLHFFLMCSTTLRPKRSAPAAVRCCPVRPSPYDSLRFSAEPRTEGYVA